jgi:hypothetical protein
MNATPLTWVPIAFGLACITGCAAVAGAHERTADVAFLGRSELLALALGHLAWELSFAFASAHRITRERTSRLPATLLRRGSLARWITAELTVTSIAALGYSAGSAVLATIVVALMGSSPAWPPEAALLVIAGGALQLTAYAALLLAVLLHRPSPLAPLVTLGAIAAAALAAPAIPFPLPVQASGTAWLAEGEPGLAVALAMPIAAIGIALAVVLTRNRFRPFDL